jgi:hypothetical protein
VSNNLRESYRYTPFVELLYPNGTSNSEGNFYDVWNSNLVGDQLVSNQNQQLNFSSDVPGMYNFNKQLMFDCLLMALPTQDMIAPKPFLKQFPFVSNPSLNMTFQYFSPLREYTPEGQSSLYNAQFYSSVYRQSTFLYYPHTTAYILYYQDPETNEKSIYVMQAMSAGTNNQMTPAQLILNPVPSTSTTNPLTPSIVVPPNWTFAYIELEENMLTVQGYGEARIVSDNLSNAYMYIYRDSSTEWLYSRYDYVSPVEATTGASTSGASTLGPAPAPSTSGTIAPRHIFGAFAPVATVLGTMFV